MKTLGDLFDALTELARTTALVQQAQGAINQGGDPQTIQRKSQDLWRMREQMVELRRRPLNAELHHLQHTLFDTTEDDHEQTST